MLFDDEDGRRLEGRGEKDKTMGEEKRRVEGGSGEDYLTARSRDRIHL